MNFLRAAVLTVGAGISLLGAYFIADGITGYMSAAGNDFFAIPKIPVGLIIAAIGVGGTLTLRKVIEPKNEGEQVQHTELAPPSTFSIVAAQQSQMGQEPPSHVMTEHQTVPAPQVETTHVPAPHLLTQTTVLDVHAGEVHTLSKRKEVKGTMAAKKRKKAAKKRTTKKKSAKKKKKRR